MRLSLAGTKFDNRFLPSFTEFYRVFNGFDWVVQGLLGCDEVFTELDWVLPGLNGYGWVQQCFTGFRWGFTEFYRVLPSFTELYRVFMGFYRVWLDSTRFHRVLMRFPQVGLGLSRILFVCCFFYRVLVGFCRWSARVRRLGDSARRRQPKQKRRTKSDVMAKATLSLSLFLVRAVEPWHGFFLWHDNRNKRRKGPYTLTHTHTRTHDRQPPMA